MAKNRFPTDPILLVDDEEDILFALSKALRQSGINNLITVKDSRKAIQILEKENVSILILDLMMPHITGEEILQQVSSEYPNTLTVILTASTKLETAIECMKMGAKDFILKPVEREEFISRIKKVLDIYELQQVNRELTSRILADELKNPDAFSKIITKNKKMRSIFKYIEAIAHSSFPVLIAGESGVGKELIAKAIHQLSGFDKEMISINVAGIDDTFFSDTLFGHTKGAFTGAVNNRKGLIEEAQNSTLFLDEIGDLEANSQKKLLRLLQEDQYYKLGSDIPHYSHARIITATCANLEEKIVNKEFRQDLFYRLKTHYIHIPPLRERKEDLPDLINFIISDIIGRPELLVSEDAVNLLMYYNYPGNIRELQAILINLCALCPDSLMTKDIVIEYFDNNNIILNNDRIEGDFFTGLSNNQKIPTLNELEELAISKVMELSNHCQSIAAPILGITQSALSKKLKKMKNQ